LIYGFTKVQTVNQKPYIKEVQGMQGPKDTKRIIGNRKSKKYRQYNGHKIPKGEIKT
jgi:hypothetical protein